MTHKLTRPVAIPDVQLDLKSVFDAVQALKMGYEGLSRQRGSHLGWPVTFGDLIDMGVVTEAQVHEQLQRRRV